MNPQNSRHHILDPNKGMTQGSSSPRHAMYPPGLVSNKPCFSKSPDDCC